MEQVGGRSNSAQSDSVEVELENSVTPFLKDSPSERRDEIAEVEAAGIPRRVFRDRRTLYFCIGVLSASVVAVCVIVGMHFRVESPGIDPDCVNSTMSSAMLKVQAENGPFSCSAFPECPEHCMGDMCTFMSRDENTNMALCTCNDQCEKDYKLLNLSDKVKCYPKCCSTEESIGTPCCPSGLANVTSETGELFCCPSHLLNIRRNIPPPFLDPDGKSSGKTVDLCFTNPPPGRTLGKEYVSYPTRPLTCV